MSNNNKNNDNIMYNIHMRKVICKLNFNVFDEDYEDDDDPIDVAFPLRRAIRREQTNLMQLIELYPMNVNQKDDDDNYPLHDACRYESPVDVVMKLIEIFPNAAKEKNIYGYYPLHIACIFGQSETVIMKLLELYPKAASIKFGNDSNRNSSMPYGYALHLACSNIQSELVIRKMIELNPNALQETRNDGDYPIHCAVIGDQSYEVIKHIMDTDTLEMKRKNNSYQESPFHIACQKNRNVVTVEYMMHYPDVLLNEVDMNGETPLHRSCRHGACRIVETLLQHPDIRVNAEDKCNKAALDVVLSNNDSFTQSSVRIMQMLLNHPFICMKEKTNRHQFRSRGLKRQRLSQLKMIEEKIMELEYRSENAGSIEDIDSELGPSIEILNLLKEFPFKRRCDSYRYLVSEFM